MLFLVIHPQQKFGYNCNESEVCESLLCDIATQIAARQQEYSKICCSGETQLISVEIVVIISNKTQNVTLIALS